jgi:hypothetical protein
MRPLRRRDHSPAKATGGAPKSVISRPPPTCRERLGRSIEKIHVPHDQENAIRTETIMMRR